MTKQTFLNDLTAQLKALNIDDIDEIAAEYDEHFTRKSADGYTEEEIARKLGDPKEIARQFDTGRAPKQKTSARKAVITTGLVFADIGVWSFFVLLLSWTLVLGATAVGTAGAAIALMLRPVLQLSFLVVPVMPYAGALILGVSLLALAVLFGVVTFYSWALTYRLIRSYGRWHRNMRSDGKYPPLSIHPLLAYVSRRRLRTVTLVALVACSG